MAQYVRGQTAKSYGPQEEELQSLREQKVLQCKRFLTTVFLLAIKFSRGSECYIWGNMFWWMAGEVWRGGMVGRGGGGDQS